MQRHTGGPWQRVPAPRSSSIQTGKRGRRASRHISRALPQTCTKTAFSGCVTMCHGNSPNLGVSNSKCHAAFCADISCFQPWVLSEYLQSRGHVMVWSSFLCKIQSGTPNNTGVCHTNATRPWPEGLGVQRLLALNGRELCALQAQDFLEYLSSAKVQKKEKSHQGGCVCAREVVICCFCCLYFKETSSPKAKMSVS